MKIVGETRGNISTSAAVRAVAITVPVNVDLDLVGNISFGLIHKAMLGNVDFRTGKIRFGIARDHFGRLQPERGPHAVRIVPTQARFPITVTSAEGLVSGHETGVVNDVAGVGGDDEMGAIKRNGVGDVDGVASMAEEPEIPLGAIKSGAIEFIGPDEVVAGRRGGMDNWEKIQRENDK